MRETRLRCRGDAVDHAPSSPGLAGSPRARSELSAGESPSLAGVNEVGQTARHGTRVIDVDVVLPWAEFDES